MIETNFRQSVSNILQNDNIYFYWKGRVALYALLKAMKVGKDDDVILPGFTCVVVANAIKYLGAIPIYVDVEKNTMNPTLESYKKAITPKTKVIITQNTFGLSTEVDEIAEMAKAKGIFSIEDCTHGFGGTFKSKPNGLYCDAAFYSTQWNKPFSTGIGGFSLVNNQELIVDVEKVNDQLQKPSFKEKLVLSALLFSREYILNSTNYWRLRSFYRFLSKHNLVIGSSQGNELESTEIPDGFFKGMSNVQLKKGVNSLNDFDNILLKRKENATIYSEFLNKNNKYHVASELFNDHSFLKYPILVRDQNKFDDLARKVKIELGDWFCSPLYPVKNNWEKWDLNAESVPNALYLSKHIENLPTDTDNSFNVIEFLKSNIDELI
ncbi:MAG: DegT/DnrJ/EryC1/StrS family aminotransferase [Bacteroidales bacterium]|nr:DegT/DnrJ/EryC1/StrS family aminotransferase [Bacteroidales bacterium]